MDTCLDVGISEQEFWNMTIGEITRLLESKQRMRLNEEKEKASFDYTLAELIGRSISRLYSSSARYPDISEVYPSLFDSQEIQEARQAKKDELSIIRFKQFAETHNKKMQGGLNTNNE